MENGATRREVVCQACSGTGRNHLTDIRIIAAWLEKEYGVPVWLVGSSRGTQSAASIAIKSHQPFAGLVLISSMAHVPDTSEPVPSMALDRITIPTLILAHGRDGCSYTPASGAALIADKLNNVSRRQVRILKAGRIPVRTPANPTPITPSTGWKDRLLVKSPDSSLQTLRRSFDRLRRPTKRTA